MKPKQMLTLLFSLLSYFSSAQQIDTIWYNAKWEKTTDPSARHYARVVEQINAQKFLVKDFYETKTMQMMGYYSSLDPEVKNGDFTYWYRNGKVQMENTYLENKTMSVVQYAENGTITNQWETVVIGKDKEGKDIIRSIEIAPKFPGGKEKMLQFIKENINYPAGLTGKEVSGRVMIKFTVNATGNVTDVKVIESLHPLLDKEAVAVVKKMPKWQPGKQDGQFVAIQLSIPILFN